MDQNALLSARQGSVASRFVSSTELEAAQTKRREEQRATYARLGQEPPPVQEEEVYDPRTLYERLQAQKDAKQEAFDEKFKLSNQFRGLDEEETSFLADVAEERREEERRKREAEREELERFRKAALARESSPPNPLALVSGSSASSSKLSGSPPSASAATKAGSPPVGGRSLNPSASSTGPNKAAKRKREGLAGIVRKKPSAATSAASKSVAGGAGASKASAAQRADGSKEPKKDPQDEGAGTPEKLKESSA